MLRRENGHVLRRARDLAGQREAEEGMVKAGKGRKCEGRFELGR